MKLFSSGQLYVMMSPQDALQSQRSLQPRSHNLGRIEPTRTGRDEKRRATHNEGEILLFFYSIFTNLLETFPWR